MTHLLGIDLGTSSIKAILTDFDGLVKAIASESYAIHTPHPGYAEQDPEIWWASVRKAVQGAIREAGHPPVYAIGLTGQMHGTVLLNKAGDPLHPAIIWADQRSSAQVNIMIDRIGARTLEQITGTLPAVGFLGPTLLWIKLNNPDLLDRVHQVVLPKDYIQYRLTGSFSTDTSDASATGLFDITQRTWANQIIQQLDLPIHIFPKVLLSSDTAGTTTQEAAEALGIQAGIPVIAGCADQVAQAITGELIEPNSASVTIGTGAQFFQPLGTPKPFSNLHTFCHAFPERWYVLGAMLSGGLSLKWLRDTLGIKTFDELEQRAASVPAGAEGLLFLPYLIGERAPIRDAHASGIFLGLTLRHEAGHLARAVMEGIAFSLRQIIEIVAQETTVPETLIASGNGLRSDVWRQICADVVNRRLELRSDTEQTALGAAYLAGYGTGVYRHLSDIPLANTVQITSSPDPAAANRYDQQYAIFTEVYPAIASTMHRLRGFM